MPSIHHSSFSVSLYALPYGRASDESYTPSLTDWLLLYFVIVMSREVEL
jgi:hypothetical protein